MRHSLHAFSPHRQRRFPVRLILDRHLRQHAALHHFQMDRGRAARARRRARSALDLHSERQVGVRRGLHPARAARRTPRADRPRAQVPSDGHRRQLEALLERQARRALLHQHEALQGDHRLEQQPKRATDHSASSEQRAGHSSGADHQLADESARGGQVPRVCASANARVLLRRRRLERLALRSQPDR